MSHLICSVCHRQFKSSSGLRWHLSRIHDRAVDRTWPGILAETRELAKGENVLAERRNRAEEGWGELASLNEGGTPCEALQQRSQDLEGQIAHLGAGIEDLKRLVADLASAGDRAREMLAESDEVVQAVTLLLWASDRPNRVPTSVADLLTTPTSALQRAREVIWARLKRDSAGTGSP